jgi:pyruvate ferredoxin oxidoreductase beta subunit
MSGVESAYRALTRRGRLSQEFRFIAIGGDGGTYDIGFQSLSGAMERGHRMLYVCYDNQAYMNTGIQRSSATPMGAHTTTSPAGEVVPGKRQARKDLTAIMVAHEIPYAAQATPAMWSDLVRKVEKALNTDGPTFITILAPCPLGWGYPNQDTIAISREAADTCFWPLYEVVNGEYKITYKPKVKKPVVGFLKQQVRYKHLFKPGNEHMLEDIQRSVDRNWAKLLKLAGEEPGA